MRLRLLFLLLFIFIIIPTLSQTRCIDFEDLTRYDPWGGAADLSGEIQDGYHGFYWSTDRMGDPRAANPAWGSAEGIVNMGGVGYTYVYTNGFSMINDTGNFDIQSLHVGSYWYYGQDVYASGWENNFLKYSSALTIDPVFQVTQFNLNFSGINHFALWAGNGGTCSRPDTGDFSLLHDLCIDSIVYDTHEPAPVSEPSTLLILGSGILGLTRMYKRYISIE